MVWHAHRQRPLPPVQPACLQQQRQTADVIGVSMGDPNRVKVGKGDTDLKKLRAARLTGIKEHAHAFNFEKDAGLKTPGSYVSRTRPKKSYG